MFCGLKRPRPKHSFCAVSGSLAAWQSYERLCIVQLCTSSLPLSSLALSRSRSLSFSHLALCHLSRPSHLSLSLTKNVQKCWNENCLVFIHIRNSIPIFNTHGTVPVLVTVASARLSAEFEQAPSGAQNEGTHSAPHCCSNIVEGP